MRKATKADHVKFHKLRAQFIEADAAREEYERALSLKYQKAHWASTTERKKLEALVKKVSVYYDRFFALLYDISPREWRGVPAYWIVEKLSWDDAVTTGPLAVRPPPGRGYDDRDLDALVARPDR